MELRTAGGGILFRSEFRKIKKNILNTLYTVYNAYKYKIFFSTNHIHFFPRSRSPTHIRTRRAVQYTNNIR